MGSGSVVYICKVHHGELWAESSRASRTPDIKDTGSVAVYLRGKAGRLQSGCVSRRDRRQECKLELIGMA